jgi:DNA modification methylase
VKIINDGMELVPLDRLSLHPRNVNQGDLGAIHESVGTNGFYGAIVAQRSTGHVLAGNHRLMTAQQAGASEIPVIWVDVDDTEALRILLADNRTTRLGTDDTAGLADLLQELLADTGTLAGTGYDADALDELLADLNREDEPPADAAPQTDRAAELQEQWGTERGQIWAIPSLTVKGKAHRLMCGDSTSAEDVGRLLGGAEPRLMVTDPPYGVEYENAKGAVTNDDRADWADAYRLFPGAVAYAWHAERTAIDVGVNLRDTGFDVRARVVWVKPSITMSRGHYHFQHEGAWYAVKRGERSDWCGDHKQSTVWNLNREDEAHPTVKPLECMARPIRNHKGDVYDPFLGSGTTMVAAENERRVCYGMEIDPGYVAVILQRMTDLGLSPHRVTRDEANG